MPHPSATWMRSYYSGVRDIVRIVTANKRAQCPGRPRGDKVGCVACAVRAAWVVSPGSMPGSRRTDVGTCTAGAGRARAVRPRAALAAAARHRSRPTRGARNGGGAAAAAASNEIRPPIFFKFYDESR